MFCFAIHRNTDKITNFHQFSLQEQISIYTVTHHRQVVLVQKKIIFKRAQIKLCFIEKGYSKGLFALSTYMFIRVFAIIIVHPIPCLLHILFTILYILF